MRFKGKTALVTGGGSGIGERIALSLAAEGAGVVVSDIRADAADQVAGQIITAGGRALAVKADVAVEQEVRSMVDMALKEFGQIDLLVNCAGVLDKIVPTTVQEVGDWQRVIDVHLRGSYLCSKIVGKQMVERRSGKIVNITSMAGVVGLPMRNAYSSAKAGMIMFTKVLAAEWARYNVNVNAVAPGYIRTRLVEKLIDNGKFSEKDIIRRTPMGRLGRTSEVAEAVLFLLSDAASYITGVNLPVDGGWGSFGSYGNAFDLD